MVLCAPLSTKHRSTPRELSTGPQFQKIRAHSFPAWDMRSGKSKTYISILWFSKAMGCRDPLTEKIIVRAFSANGLPTISM